MWYSSEQKHPCPPPGLAPEPEPRRSWQSETGAGLLPGLLPASQRPCVYPPAKRKMCCCLGQALLKQHILLRNLVQVLLSPWQQYFFCGILHVA